MHPRDLLARVEAIEELPLPYFAVHLEVSDEYLAIEPGQFVMVETRPGLEPYLRRAFSVHAVRTGAEGKAVVELLAKVVGKGTAALARRRPGETVAVLGPLGRPFTLPGSGEGRVALVAGGVGSAPLRILAEKLLPLGCPIDVFYGGRTARDLPRLEIFERLCRESAGRIVVTTEDGSLGIRGRVTEPLEEAVARRSFARLYACGPMPLLARVAALAAPAEIPAEGALETEMGCGFGACLGCAVPLRSGRYALCCKDGPVFSLAEVSW